MSATVLSGPQPRRGFGPNSRTVLGAVTVTVSVRKNLVRLCRPVLVAAALSAMTSSCGLPQSTPTQAALSAALLDGPLFTTTAPASHYFDPHKIPTPFVTPSVQNFPRVVARPAGAQLHVPPGFAIGVWASGLPNPRAMALAPNGDVFVAESAVGAVAVLRGNTQGEVAKTSSVFADGLHKPFGMAFYPPGPKPAYVYVANTDSVVRFPYHDGDLRASGPAQTIIPDLPANGYNNHWTRRLLFTPDGKRLLVSVGSAANVEANNEFGRADILSYNPDGTGMQIYASGLRNPVGLAWNPVTGDLWTAVNERDGMGDTVPNDYVTSVKPGGFYGWPYYYTGPNHDARMPDRPDLLAKISTPDVLLEAHCAALSVTFYSAHQFPSAYFHQAFTAMHGSWNRSTRAGYKVVQVLMNRNGTAHGDYSDFVWGWVTPDGQVWGRPVDTLVASDGSLLITDDGSGTIWRMSYTGKKD